jgi:hypothetical protein
MNSDRLTTEELTAIVDRSEEGYYATYDGGYIAPCYPADSDVRALLSEIEALRAELGNANQDANQLRRNIRRYARHTEGCEFEENGPCNCWIGFTLNPDEANDGH